jgi:hypothetical protein
MALKPTRAMSDRHESDLAEMFEGRMTRGSGNQARDQMDGKQAYRSQHYVFAWDGKSTLGKAISVTREMWEKAKEQAHWATPILPLRWYANERLTEVAADLVVLEAETLADLQRDANAYRTLLARIEGHDLEALIDRVQGAA